MPYVCTYPVCNLSDYFFRSREEWYKHETQEHRVAWFCNTNGHPHYAEHFEFLAHMELDHNTVVDDSELSLLENMFKQPSRSPKGQCNLCLRKSENIKSHVSRHLQHIALFALPRGNETLDSGKADIDTRSTQPEVRASIDKRQWEDKAGHSQSSHSSSEDKYSELDKGGQQTPDGIQILQHIDYNGDPVNVPDEENFSWDLIASELSEDIRHDTDPVLQTFAHRWRSTSNIITNERNKNK